MSAQQVGTSRGSRWVRATANWWLPTIPLARVAVFRVLVYSFVIVDILKFLTDVIPHGYQIELYQPVLIGRVLPFPEPSVGYAIFLQWSIIIACIVAMTGYLPRISGFAVAVLFLAWLENSQGFSYVQHDHMALVLATWVLPTVGRARFYDERSSQAAGWALRMVQVATIATYFGSVFSKIASNGWSFIAWPNSSVFTWAFMRRGSDLITWTLNYPWLLKSAQWGLYIVEVLSPVVLFLRGRWLYLAVGFFFLFHFATYLSLGIHFLPTVMCWFAFLPLEKIPYALRRTVNRFQAAR
ncbi:hypothetical protein ACFSYH_14645 [Populibacterium corticicola]|uniref:HTTM-like domain-containing protein n=1 Tax=Populibacterium corticicola TaxID=1812826 RepID=A0ABW5XJP5_9MICO